MTKLAHAGRVSPRPFERKDDNGAGNVVAEMKKAVEPVMTAFEQYKQANDARLAEIEKKGVADPVTTDKLAKLDQHFDKYEGLNQRITAAEKIADQVKSIDERFDRLETALKRTTNGMSPEEKAERTNLWCKSVVLAHTLGVPNLSAEQREVLEAVNNEYKSLSVGVDSAGGYLAPVEYVREIIKGETEISPFRSLVRVRQTANKSVQLPKRTGQFAAQRVSEQGTRSETTGLTYGLEEVPVHELFALVDISNAMLEDSAFDMAAEISMEAQEQFAVKEGAEFVSGTGVGQAEGILATSAGLSSTVSGTAATIADSDGQANGLLTLKHAIKTAYTRNANWAMNRTTLGSVRKLKDADKNYIWMPGLAQGKPNTIDGDPYIEVPDMPNEGANTYPIAYGDFRRGYVWIDRISMEMLRDPYTQATSGNVRFIIRKRSGGQVVLAEAIRLLKCST